MTTAQIPGITPPPSVEDVLGALPEEARIGQVDFTTRLAPEVVEEPTRSQVADLLDTGAAPSVAELLPGTGPDTDDDRLDEDAPEAVEIRRDASPVAEAPAPVAAEPTHAPRPPARPRRLLGRRHQPSETTATEPTAEHLAPHAPARPTRVMVPPPADVLAQPAEEAEEALVALLRRPPVGQAPATAPAAEAAPHRPRAEAPAQPQSLRLVDERPPTVEELARLVVERLHDAELAMMRHLEAMQAEADRRMELATAQAELDADLIRLHARREAHAIITAARRRAGLPVDDPAERAVSEVTEALGRFADVMDELRPPRYRTMS